MAQVRPQGTALGTLYIRVAGSDDVVEIPVPEGGFRLDYHLTEYAPTGVVTLTSTYPDDGELRCKLSVVCEDGSIATLADEPI